MHEDDFRNILTIKLRPLFFYLYYFICTILELLAQNLNWDSNYLKINVFKQFSAAWKYFLSKKLHIKLLSKS